MEFPDESPLTAPTIGQYNADILREWLGHSDPQMAALRAAKVLHEDEI